MPFTLTARDTEIIDVLAHRVRVMSLDQIARTWWAECKSGKKAASVRMATLSGQGLVIPYRVLAHPEIPLPHPVTSWTPAQPTPEFSAVAYRLQSRWSKPPITVTCYMASKRTGRTVGGTGGRRSRTTEQTHDIHFAAVFLQYRHNQPSLIRNWISEAAILRDREDRREKLPDAIVTDGEMKRVIEFGGSYGRDKIEAFHNYCSEQELPYEIW